MACQLPLKKYDKNKEDRAYLNLVFLFASVLFVIFGGLQWLMLHYAVGIQFRGYWVIAGFFILIVCMILSLVRIQEWAFVLRILIVATYCYVVTSLLARVLPRWLGEDLVIADRDLGLSFLLFYFLRRSVLVNLSRIWNTLALLFVCLAGISIPILIFGIEHSIASIILAVFTVLTVQFRSSLTLSFNELGNSSTIDDMKEALAGAVLLSFLVIGLLLRVGGGARTGARSNSKQAH